MSILSRIPNLIPSTPSSAPQDAMIASQKTHINELVQKARTLDNTIKDLQEQLTNSRAKWQAEHREWIDGCDSLMGCHRIAHLRTNVRLARERVALAHERDLIRRERVAVIQRDYNLILFKAREKELEIGVDQLREELGNATNGNVALVAQLRNKLAEGMRELKEKATLLRDAEKAREKAEEQATHIRTEHAALQGQLSSARTNVERLTLRLEDAQTVLAEKERSNTDLQQEKATLKVHIEKWKSLDDRGGAQVEELHTQRAALEGQLKRLESRLAEEQSKASARENAIQKEQKKIEKLQRALEEQSRIAEEAKAAAESNSNGDTKTNKKVQKLMAALEEQADKTAKAEEEVSLLEEQSQHYKDQLDKALRQIEKLNANSQPNDSRSRSRVQSGSDQVDAENPGRSELSPSLAKSGEPTSVGPPSRKPAPFKKPDGNGKVTKKPDVGKARQKRQPSTSDNKGKRKALPDDDEAAEDASEKTTKPTKRKPQKSRTAVKESQPADVEIDTEDDTVPKKKKMRKLNVNIFGTAQPDSLDWANQFNVVGGSSLDIPTELSPVKVPARSMARNSVSTLRKS